MAQDEEQEPPITRTTEQARAGATPHMTRYILLFGLSSIILLFLILLIIWMRG